MRMPLSWLKDFVDIDISVEELAYRLTLAGLEVEAIHYIGLPLPEGERHEFKVTGLAWDPDKIVVGAVLEVMPHPDADRLVLCRLDDGEREHIVLTGAPNLFPYKGQGPLDKPLKVPYAREGAVLLDPYSPDYPNQTMVLKRRKIRGVESYSMICSEKELGISEEHEGIIILDDDAPVGMPLVEYMGDAVLEIAITPNMARNTGILGVAREAAALLGKPLREPSYEVVATGAPIEGQAAVEITDPELNPRFVLGLIRNVRIGPSPYWVQRRLRLAGMRPINNIVDATNYVMLELGEPLHAFDYEVLQRRAGGKAPTIITRTARPGEKLTTLDNVERTLPPFTVLVCDTAGPLSIAGVMGGAESEVSDQTRHVLLEGAAWNFINIRRTERALGLTTEASYRFSRGVHPALAEPAVKRCLELMRQWAGGEVAQGLVDNYPNPPQDPVVTITTAEVARALGVHLSAQEVADLLGRLGFTCTVEGDRITAQTPPHRLDIGTGVVGKADLMEEIARIYGYDRIPETRLADALPPQKGNPDLEREERLRDALVNLGLQEVITYRLTSPEREARFASEENAAYIELANPIAVDRRVMRRHLLPGLLEVAERNARFRQRQALFEIGPVFLPREGELLPNEPRRLAIVLTGPRTQPHWETAAPPSFDFYDLKGLLEGLADALHLPPLTFDPGDHPALHPGKCATVRLNGKALGFLGELHPETQARYEHFTAPVLVAELDAEALLRALPDHYALEPIPTYPPVIEDLSVVVDETIPAAEVEAVMRRAGGKRLVAVRLFDVYRGEQIGAGKKSLTYRLTYQDPSRTLTDKDAAKIRQRIIQALERELNAAIRGG